MEKFCLRYGRVHITTDDGNGLDVIGRVFASMFPAPDYPRYGHILPAARDMARNWTDSGILAVAGYEHGPQVSITRGACGGVAAGDLAFLHNYRPGRAGEWDMDVKCKVLTVWPEARTVTVLFTSDTYHYDRGERRTVPMESIRRRDYKSR